MSANDRLPEGTHLTYIVSQKHWDTNIVPLPELYISASYTDGGASWGFPVREHTFSDRTTAIRAEVFHDAFAAFTQIPEFFAALADEEIVTLDGVRELLDRMGALEETRQEAQR